MAPAKEKRGARRKEDKMTPADPLTKEQKAVATWLRRNVPTKTTKFMYSHKVEYFTGKAAVDKLLKDSPYAKKNVKDPETQLYFEYRDQCVDFMDDLLRHKMFHRAKKIPVDDKLLKAKKKKSKATEDESDANAAKDNDKAPAAAGSKKKGKKIRLDMHLEQVFLDSTDAYVWIYDPTPWYYWVVGAIILLGAIAFCLFPLWPPWMRQGVHYLSIAAAAFLVGIIALGILKYIIFALLFILSGGKLRFWIFPNLTEDVGFFESFWPIYDYTYTGTSTSKKAKDSDDEESDDEDDEKNDEADQSESDDSTSKKSSVAGKDFEMVDKHEDTDAWGCESVAFYFALIAQHVSDRFFYLHIILFSKLTFLVFIFLN